MKYSGEQPCTEKDKHISNDLPMKRHSATIIFFILPYLIFHWMAPFVSELAPGRDFIRYFIWWQTEFLFSMRTGTFPLLMNMTSGGLHSVMAAGFGQIYLPYPYLAAMLPGYWTGHALEYNIVLHFLVIGLVHLTLFKFLRAIKLKGVLAFFLSTVTLYSTTILFPMSYGVAVDAWTGHLFLCAVIGLFYLHPTRIKGPLFIIFSTYWLVCSGHPEFMYYGLLGAGIFTVLLPFFDAALCPDKNISFKAMFSFWIHTGGYCAIGIALSAAYVLPFYFEIVKKLLLANQTYAGAGGLTDTYLGCVSNFFSPLRASVMASFGGNPLLPALICVPVLRLFRVRVPAVVWITSGLILLLVLGTLGEHMPVHRLTWQYLPFASATRISGRLAAILPVLFMLLAIWVFHSGKTALRVAGFNTSPLPVLTATAFFLYVIYIVFIITSPSKNDLFPFSRINITLIPAWVEPFTIITTITLLGLVTLYASGIGKKHLGLFLSVLTVFHIVFLFKFYPTPRVLIGDKDRPTFQQFLAQKKERPTMFQEQYLFPFDAPTTYDINTIPQVENYFIEPHLGKIYRKYIVAANREDAYRILNTTRRQDQIVVENYRPDTAPAAMVHACDTSPDRVVLTYTSYNKMVYKTQTCAPAFFLFPYTRSDNWAVRLDGKTTSTYRANGYAQAVRLPAGEHTLEFKYGSWASFWGMAISCATLALIGLVVGFSLPNKLAGYLTATVAIIAALALFFAWYHSLYTGDNLGTDYAWESGEFLNPENLAYGKPTAMSGHYPDTPYKHNSRHGVDGDRSRFSCFITGDQQSPWWEVDLQKPEKISTITLYTSLQGEVHDKMIVYFPDNHRATLHKGSLTLVKTPVLFNHLPLTIAVSTDHEHWQTTSINSLKKDKARTIKLDPPIGARYVKIRASGKCRLSFNEVEIYPPGNAPGATALDTY